MGQELGQVQQGNFDFSDLFFGFFFFSPFCAKKKEHKWELRYAGAWKMGLT